MFKKIRHIRKTLLFLTFALGMLIIITSHTHAATTTYYDKVTNGSYSGGYYIRKVASFNDLTSALKEARTSATKSTPYKIVVKPGKYTTTNTLYLSANTYLYAQGATFVQSSDVVKNMIRTYNDGSTTASGTNTGYVNNNITIDGGKWNENGHTNVLLKLALGSNITVKNATFENTTNAHLAEVAGINGFTVSNCTFQNQYNYKNIGYYEAIQLDILVSDHVTGIRSEDIAMQNVTITKCKFINVPRGVGSHSSILNNPIKNIKITNNTFTNTTNKKSKYYNRSSCAIQLLSVYKCTISGNKISNCPRGIVVFGGVFTGQDTYLSTDVAKEGNSVAKSSTKYKAPANMGIVISKNKITLGGTDPYATYEKCGICVAGLDGSTSNIKSGSTLPKGNYYLNGATISGNVVRGNGHGIKLQDARNVKVTGNSLAFTGTSGTKNYHGIVVRLASKSFSITSNRIYSNYVDDIFVKDSAATVIQKNVVYNAKKYNIGIQNSTVNSISYNKCIKAAVDAIHLRTNVRVASLVSNSIYYAKRKGISAGNKSSVYRIANNVFVSCGTALTVSTDSTANLTLPVPKSIKIRTTNKAMNVSYVQSIISSGVEIQYSLKKNMKKATIKRSKLNSLMIRNLIPKKIYYVRVRSYKKIGSRTVYSTWSRIKKIKISNVDSKVSRSSRTTTPIR